MHLTEMQTRRYALGETPAAEAWATEQHLLTCASCQAGVRSIREEVVQLTDALAPIEPETATWSAIQRRLEHRELRPSLLRPSFLRSWLAAAAVVVLALGGWGTWQQHGNTVLHEEQQVVGTWMARSDVRVLSLTNRARRLKGRLLLASDHTALFVLPPPPPGQRYHAWISGKPGWKFGDPLRLVQTSTDGVFLVGVGTTDYLCVSLEREVRPTRLVPANVVGYLFL